MILGQEGAKTGMRREARDESSDCAHGKLALQSIRDRQIIKLIYWSFDREID